MLENRDDDEVIEQCHMGPKQLHCTIFYIIYVFVYAYIYMTSRTPPETYKRVARIVSRVLFCIITKVYYKFFYIDTIFFLYYMCICFKTEKGQNLCYYVFLS